MKTARKLSILAEPGYYYCTSDTDKDLIYTVMYCSQEKEGNAIIFLNSADGSKPITGVRWEEMSWIVMPEKEEIQKHYTFSKELPPGVPPIPTGKLPLHAKPGSDLGMHLFDAYATKSKLPKRAGKINWES